MIVLKNIHKVFHKETPVEIIALNNINLTINKNEFVILLGANGSGKSTLLNLLAGSVLADSGKIIFDNQDVTAMPEFRRSVYVARVFQNPFAGTASDLTVLENFRLASIRTKSKSLSIGTTNSFRKSIKEKILELGMGLENKLDNEMGMLSGGQRQALTLLMSVTDRADILLLDEPTASLDPRTAELIMKITDTIITRFNLTAVLVTHNIKDALNYGSRIIQMNEGAIAKDIIKNETAGLTPGSVYEWFN